MAGSYCSVVVAHADLAGRGPLDLDGCVAAVNSEDSLSGSLLLAAWLGPAAAGVRTRPTGTTVHSQAGSSGGERAMAA